MEIRRKMRKVELLRTQDCEAGYAPASTRWRRRVWLVWNIQKLNVSVDDQYYFFHSYLFVDMILSHSHI